MRYLNSLELSQFHDVLLKMFQKHATNVGKKNWGHPHGIDYCDTYSFNTKCGTLYIGHDDYVQEERWWIPIVLEEQISGDQLSIAFEMNIPKTRNMRLSVHYAIDDDNIVHILHKGKVTVGHGAVSMRKFFSYYQNNPGRWQVIRFSGYEYLELGEVSLPITDDEFLGLLKSLAEFANYVPGFKDNYR